jgi:hypothetical protein
MSSELEHRRAAKSDVYSESRKYNIIEESSFAGFFEVLEETGRYSAACRSVGWSQHELLAFRRDNTDFQDLCNNALEAFKDAIINVAKHRAVVGIERAVLGGEKGERKVIEREKVPSDRLMELFLKRADSTFIEKQKVEVTGEIDLRKEMDLKALSPRARAKLKELLLIIREDEDLKAIESAEKAIAIDVEGIEE